MFGSDFSGTKWKVVESCTFSGIFLIKDARSVSLYPYNRSQILQYVK